MQVSLGYAKPKSFVLTPTQKNFGRLVAHCSKMVIAEECNDVKDCVITKVGNLIRSVFCVPMDMILC